MLDVEMKALRAIARALEPLSETARRRLVGYLHDALGDSDQASAEPFASDLP